jgi:hypothetical protein
MPVKRKWQSRTATGINSTKASKACFRVATCTRSRTTYATANRRRGGEMSQITKAPHHGEKPVYARRRAAPQRIAFRLDNASEPAKLYVLFTHRLSLFELILEDYVGWGHWGILRRERLGFRQKAPAKGRALTPSKRFKASPWAMVLHANVCGSPSASSR